MFQFSELNVSRLDRDVSTLEIDYFNCYLIMSKNFMMNNNLFSSKRLVFVLNLISHKANNSRATLRLKTYF